MFLHAMGGKPIQYEEKIATGNPATFETNINRPLAQFFVPFTPMQTGSGDPSPSNVRNITGWPGFNIYQSGAYTSDPDTIPVSWSTQFGTIGGGSLDVTTGTLTIDTVYYSSTWGNMTAGTSTEVMQEKLLPIIEQIIVAGGSGASQHVCNVAKYQWKAISETTPHFYCAYSNSLKKYAAFVYLPIDTDASTVVQVAAKLLEPFTVHIDPVSITTLRGENNLWTDTNGTNTVIYLAKR
jgi:hypothetical protein